MSGAQRLPLVMATYWTGETEYVAGIGEDRDAAYLSLIHNPDIDASFAAKIKKNRDCISYQELRPCSSGWTTTTE